jgi:hypothetical protein
MKEVEVDLFENENKKITEEKHFPDGKALL